MTEKETWKYFIECDIWMDDISQKQNQDCLCQQTKGIVTRRGDTISMNAIKTLKEDHLVGLVTSINNTNQ